LREDDIPTVMTESGPAAVKRFVDLANERGGKDNITVVIVEID
jgi:protein phosphatase